MFYWFPIVKWIASIHIVCAWFQKQLVPSCFLVSISTICYCCGFLISKDRFRFQKFRKFAGNEAMRAKNAFSTNANEWRHFQQSVNPHSKKMCDQIISDYNGFYLFVTDLDLRLFETNDFDIPQVRFMAKGFFLQNHRLSTSKNKKKIDRKRMNFSKFQ